MKVKQPDWKKPLTTHADRLERVAKIRNAVCHTPMVPSKKHGGFEFTPAAAAKLLKGMTIRSKDDYSVERVTLDRVKQIKPLAMEALGAKVRSAMVAKKGEA